MNFGWCCRESGLIVAGELFGLLSPAATREPLCDCLSLLLPRNAMLGPATDSVLTVVTAVDILLSEDAEARRSIL